MYSAKNSCFQNVELIQPWEFSYNIDGVPFKSRGLQAQPLAMFCPRDQSLVYSLQWVSPLDQYSPSHLPYLIIVDLSPISHLWIWVLLGHWAFYVFYFDLRGSWHCMKPTRELFFFLISMGIIKSSAKNSKKWREILYIMKSPQAFWKSLWTRWLFFALKQDYWDNQQHSLNLNDLKVMCSICIF